VARAKLAHVQPSTAGIEHHMPMRIYSPKQQGDVALKLHVAKVYFKFFKCLEVYCNVFYIDVVKVDCDVAYIAMIFSGVCPNCFMCYRHVLQMFHLDVTKEDMNVTSVCFRCFIRTLQVFYLDVAYVL
jgi:hypothetical protein